MDAGAWYIGEGDERQIVFRFYGNEAMLSSSDWAELCTIVDEMRDGKEASMSDEYARILTDTKVVKRIPVGEKLTLEMLGISTTPIKSPFSKPIRRF